MWNRRLCQRRRENDIVVQIKKCRKTEGKKDLRARIRLFIGVFLNNGLVCFLYELYYLGKRWERFYYREAHWEKTGTSSTL